MHILTRTHRDAPVKLLEKFMHGRKKTATEQVVVLSQVLDSDVNTGYEYLVNTQLLKFNGVPVENIAQLAKVQRRFFLKLQTGVSVCCCVCLHAALCDTEMEPHAR